VTSLLDGLLAFIVAALLNVVVIVNIRSRTDHRDGVFLVRVYSWAIILRYALAVLLNIFVTDSAFAAAFWGDSWSYDIGGYQLSLRWSGGPIASAYMSTAVSGYGWVHFVGAIYYIFGRNALLVQLLNGLLSGLTVLVIYAISARLFDRYAARWAALFMAFFPQMVFWSTGMYKDPAVLLCIAVSMYSVVALRDGLSFSTLAMFVAAETALITLRFYIAYFVAFAAFATFAFGQRRGAIRMAFTYALLGVLLFGALSIAVRRETLEQQATYMTLERLQVTREDQALWGRSGFGHEYNVSTPAGALATIPIGLVYLLFAPFPWAVSGLRQALVLPETLVWYALMPAFVRGLGTALRRQLRAILPILVFAASLTLAYALMQGNVGTAYRQRTQVTMFFFIFMAVGIVDKRRQRASKMIREALPAALPRQS
jgi:4-amino-4-deoxy-L-arabinose transferase-like glycosyltransferase